METRKRKKKFYMIIDKKSRFNHGVFPRTTEGYGNAKTYKKELEKNSTEKFVIK